MVSRDSVNCVSRVIIVVPITTYRGQRLYPSDVLVQAPEGGLGHDSVVLGLQVRAVDVQRLGPVIGAFDQRRLNQVSQALTQVLDLEGC